ncbi:hypothetical protein OAL04_00780 [Nitrospinae bacterium]|nr:hypothetical protein [Nitrospinota bacterium]
MALTQTVQAQIVGSSHVTTRHSSRVAISPYAQAVPNDSYTFIGVSHPSLDTAVTQIGVVLEVIDMTTTVDTAAGRAVIFTVGAGETHRVFVANQSHSDINATNTAFQDARTHIIPTVNSAQFGSVRVTSVSERPQLIPAQRFILGQDASKKFDNVGQLSIWGIVYTQASGTGFAMEFIGDAHDSTTAGYEAADFRSERSVLGGGGNNDLVSTPAKAADAPRHGRGIGR